MTAVELLETLAAQDRAAAMREVDSLISTLQSLRSDLDSEQSIAWWGDAFDARKAQAAVVRAVAASANLGRVAALARSVGGE